MSTLFLTLDIAKDLRLPSPLGWWQRLYLVNNTLMRAFARAFYPLLSWQSESSGNGLARLVYIYFKFSNSKSALEA
jgi:hypothetical protein